MYRYFLTPLHKTMILSYRSLCACSLMFGLLLWRSTHYWHCLSLSACIIYILPNPVSYWFTWGPTTSHCYVVMSYMQHCGLRVITHTDRDVNMNCYIVIKMWGKKNMHPISLICIICSIYVNLPLVFYMFSLFPFSFFWVSCKKVSHKKSVLLIDEKCN